MLNWKFISWIGTVLYIEGYWQRTREIRRRPDTRKKRKVFWMLVNFQTRNNLFLWIDSMKMAQETAGIYGGDLGLKGNMLTIEE